MSESKPAGEKSRSHRFAVLLITVAVIIAALLLTAVEFRPIQQVPAAADDQEQITLAQIISKLMLQTRQSMSRKQVFCTVKLTGQEVNCLLNMAMRFYAGERKEHDPLLYAVRKDNVFRTEVSLKRLGVYWNIRCDMSAAVKDKKLLIRTESAQLGNLPLPPSVIDRAIAEKLAQLQQDKRCKLALTLIQRIESMDDGMLAITFKPQLAAAAMSLF